MGAVQDREKAFQDEFNRILGNKIGRPLKPLVIRTPSKKEIASLSKIIMEGKAAQKASQAGPSRARPDSSSTRGTPLTDEQKKARDKNFLKESKVTKEGNRSFFDKFKDVVGKTMDVISRPGYTVTGALYEQAKAMAEGEPFWSTGDELLYGGWRGASGQAKHGAGDVLREKKKGSNYKGGGIGGLFNQVEHAGSMFFDPLGSAAEISKKLPKGAQKWFDRGVGLAGDIGYDPLTYATGGTEFVAKNVGKEAGKAVLGDVLKKSVRKSVTDTATGLGFSTAKSNNVGKRVLKKLEDLNLDIHGGGQAKKNISSFATKKGRATLANASGEAARSELMDKAAGYLDNVVEAMEKGNTPNLKRIENLKKADPVFRDLHDEYLNQVRNMTTHGKSLVSENYRDAQKLALNKVSKDFTPMVEQMVDLTTKEFTKNLTKAPVLRIGGQTVLKSEKIGNAFAKLSERIAESPLDEVFKSLSYGRGNPGVALGLGGKTRSELTHTYEKLFKEVEEHGKRISNADARTIQEALQDGVELADPALETERKWLRSKYNEIFDFEEKFGLRDSASAGPRGRLEDYVYTNFKSNSRQSKDIRDAMRASVKTKKSYEGYTLADLQGKGVRPETNAFNNLLARQLKANRDIAPISYIRQINEKFGIKGIMSKAELEDRGLIEISKANREFPPSVLNAMKPGEKLYVTPDTAAIVRRYRDFADVGSKEHGELLHAIDYVTSKFKRSATLYYPSFHVRNFIGDMVMGSMDGVGIRDYIKIFNKWKSKASSEISIGGIKKPFHEMVELYEKNLGSSGHFIQEIGKGKPLKRISGTIGDWAEKREDFGRFAHFVHAMDEEVKAQLKRGVSPTKAWENGLDAAAFRVNKYKFDYSALTKLEQKYFKRAIPFYTYPRKAISTLAEAAVISPRVPATIAGLIDNWQQYAEKNNTEFNPIGMPGWMRDSPLVPFTKGKNPLGLDVGSMLPFQGATGWMQNPLSNVNPIFRSVAELTYGKNAFTHEDVKNPIDVIRQNFRPFNEKNKITKDSPGLVKISNFLGIPVRQVSAGQQDAQVEALKYKAKGDIQKWDDKAMKQGYHVVFSERKYDDKYGGVSVKIFDTKDDRLVKEFPYFNDETKAWLKKLLG